MGKWGRMSIHYVVHHIHVWAMCPKCHDRGDQDIKLRIVHRVFDCRKMDHGVHPIRVFPQASGSASAQSDEMVVSQVNCWGPMQR